MIPGLMVDGLNYSGKTTALRLLREKFDSMGVTCDYRKCHLSRAGSVFELHGRAFELLGAESSDRFPDPAYMGSFNAAMSALLVLDTELERSARYSSPVLQDRHWLSQYLNNEFFTPGVGHLPAWWVRERAPRFRRHVYLTCSHESRLRRHRTAERGKTHRLNRYLIKHVERFAAFEDANLARVAALGFVEIIDADRLTPRALADLLLTRLLAGVDVKTAADLATAGRKTTRTATA